MNFDKFIEQKSDKVVFYGDNGLAFIGQDAFVAAAVAVLGDSKKAPEPVLAIAPPALETSEAKNSAAEPPSIDAVYIPMAKSGALALVQSLNLKNSVLKAMVDTDPFGVITELAIGRYLYEKDLSTDEFINKFKIDCLHSRSGRSGGDGSVGDRYWYGRMRGLHRLYAALIRPNSYDGRNLAMFFKNEGISRVEQYLGDRTALMGYATREVA